MALRGVLSYLRVCLAMILLVSAVSCGGGGGGGGGGDDGPTTTPGTPSISNSVVSATSAAVAVGSSTRISGTFNFVDEQGDLDTMTLVVYDESGKMLDAATSGSFGPIGKTGTISWSVAADTSTPGVYSIALFVTDKAGHVSNTLRFFFTVFIPPWTTLASLPAAQTVGCIVVVNDKIYVVGGQDYEGTVGYTTLRSVLEYDPVTNVWTKKTSMPTQKVGFGYAVLNNKIYTVGGSASPGNELKMLEVYDPATDAWSRMADMPFGLAYPKIAAVEGKIYAFDSNGRFFIYDPAADTWVLKTTGPLGVGYETTVSALNGRVYLVGNFAGNIGHCYDPVMDAWTTLPPMAQDRWSVEAFPFDGKLYVIGGYTFVDGSTYTSTLVEVYDPTTNHWSARRPYPIERDGARVLGSVSGKFYLYTIRHTASFSSVGEMWAYDPLTDTWSAKTPIPSIRTGFGSVVLGDRIIVAGGLTDPLSMSIMATMSVVEEYDTTKE